jgi:hypothetical protein
MVWRTNLEAAIQEDLGTSLNSSSSRPTPRRRTSRAAPPIDLRGTNDLSWDETTVRRMLVGVGIDPKDEDVKFLVQGLRACGPLLAEVRQVTATGEEQQPFEPRWE